MDKRTMTGDYPFSAQKLLLGQIIGPAGDVYSLGIIMKLFFANYVAQDDIFELINNMTEKSNPKYR